MSNKSRVEEYKTHFKNEVFAWFDTEGEGWDDLYTKLAIFTDQEREKARREGAIEEIMYLSGYPNTFDGDPLYYIDIRADEVDERIKALEEMK